MKPSDKFDPRRYWEERLQNNYGLRGVGYLGLGENYNTWLYKIKRKVFTKTAKSLDLEYRSKDVLDIGSGTGFFVGLWKELGVKSITGCDLTNIVIEELRKTYPKDNFVRLDIGESITNGSLGTYDIVSAFDVLYHILDDSRYKIAIKNIHHALRPDGLFLLSENFLHNQTERGTHQVSRTLRDIELILQEIGFIVISRAPLFMLMNDPVDSGSNFRRLFWKATMLPVTKSEKLGFFMGAILYFFESILVSRRKESPTTEIMVCKKIR